MFKMIVAIDSLKYSPTVVKYALDIAKKTTAHVVGVFLDDFTYHSYKVSEVMAKGAAWSDEQDMLEEQDHQTRQASVKTFTKTCQEAGVNFSIHHDRNVAFLELIHESIYADLLVIDSSETLTHHEENIPSRFIRDILAEIQCPVLIVPHVYQPIEKLMLLYDGQPASVYAIKSFSYLFSALKYLETEVVTVKDVDESKHVPDTKLVKEFMKRHYPDALYTVLNGQAEKEIVKHLQMQDKTPLMVLGGHKSNIVSRLFNRSMADFLLEELNAPLFIAHHG